MENNLWEELSEENKKIIINQYQKYKLKISDCCCVDIIKDNKIRMSELENLFGKENLNPIIINNWEDVLKYKNDHNMFSTVKDEINRFKCINNDDKLQLKLISTFKIAKIIEFGYDGLVDKNDIDEQTVFTITYKIVNSNKVYPCYDFKFEIKPDYNKFDLLSFRTEEDANRFLENNEDLIKKYYML